MIDQQTLLYAVVGWERRFLEQVTHPRIGARLHARLDELRRGETTSVVVLDAPLLLEAGWDRLCDALVFVAAPRALREQRARARGWTLEELDAREAAQQPLAEKQSRATWIIDNSREPAETAVRVAQIWQELRQRFPDKVPHTRPATGASRY